MLDNAVETVTQFVASLPFHWQWLGVMVAGTIPFIESYLGTTIGVLVGIHPVCAAAAAIVGNAASMLVFVLTVHKARTTVVGSQSRHELSPRKLKLKKMFDRYGVAVVSLVGQTVLPSQITSAAMVGFGASRTTVIAWQLVSIVLWGVVFALLSTGIIGAIS